MREPAAAIGGTAGWEAGAVAGTVAGVALVCASAHNEIAASQRMPKMTTRMKSLSDSREECV